MDIPLGIALIVLGAVLAFAVQNEPSGLNLDAMGWILILVGLTLIVLSLTWWGRRSVRRVEERAVVQVEEREIHDEREFPL